VPSDLALITGASRGIGRSTAKVFASSGLKVFAISRNLEDLSSLQKEIVKDSGQCIYQSTDLMIVEQIDQVVERMKSTGLKIAALVHNAGIAKVGQLKDIKPTDWRETIEINLIAPFILTHKLFPFLSDHCHIFFMNSVAGRQTFPEWSAYCASKWGLKALADVLRQELSGTGIKVTSVYPSSVDTGLHDQLPYEWDREKMLKDDDVAEAIIACFKQSSQVQVREIDLENLSGTF